MAHLFWLQFVMTHEMCSRCRTQPQIRKAGIIRTSQVVAIKILKDPHTWLKMVTTIKKAPYRKCPNWSKTCFDLCDPDLWPLILTFGLDITFVNGYYFWNFHDDTMRATLRDRWKDHSWSCLVAAEKWYEKNKTGKIYLLTNHYHSGSIKYA